MSGWSAETLPWLPRPPEDFAHRCRHAAATDDPAATFRWLAGHGLGLDDLTRLAKRWRACRAMHPDPVGDAAFTPFRLGVVSNATTGLLTPCLEATALRYGIDLEPVTAAFGQTVAEALNPQSPINRARADAVLLALDHRGLPLADRPGEADDGGVAESLAQIRTMAEGFLQAGCKTVLLQTLAAPPEPLFGSLEPRVAGTLRQRIDHCNRLLIDEMAAMGGTLFDVAGLAATVGGERWHDPPLWNQARLAFSPDFLPLYADHLLRLIAAVLGKSRKCLVLDLDNTLWGGVIGDDGLEGIALAQGDPRGEAHLAVQRTALALRQRGVILAVCSKNEEETARLPFRNHPEMILKESHIACFVANWGDKAGNLEMIARHLDIGVDALVLLDDNPAERAQVRGALPQVAVPELPADPALFVRTLLAAGCFEAVSFTADDRLRADQYQANAGRALLRERSRDLDGFLRSLEMVVTFAPFDAVGRARITQLINKTNQFNLTTRRHTEARVAAMERDPALFTLQVRLRDRFGDNGMISVVICQRRDDCWQIDSWLMSCRVLNRRVEEAVFAHLIDNARQAGVRTLLGRHIPTARNGLVADHYARLGFSAAPAEETDAPGTTVWRFEVEGFKPVPLPLTVAGEP